MSTPTRSLTPVHTAATAKQMAVFASTTTVNGRALTDIIGTEELPNGEWEELKGRVIQGGKHIIELRGRSSFQSPAYLSIEMIAAAMGGKPFRWPVGTYVNNGHFDHIMMATGDNRRRYRHSLPRGRGYSRRAPGARAELQAPLHSPRRSHRHGRTAPHQRMARPQPQRRLIHPI